MFPVEVSYTQEPVSDYVRSAVETVISIHETVCNYLMKLVPFDASLARKR